MEHIRINSISVKRFFLLGIVMLSGYLGFAQTAVINIKPNPGNSQILYNYYELEYRNIADTSDTWTTIDGIVAGSSVSESTTCVLDDLECDAVYEVRVRAYLEDEFGDRIYGLYGTIQITTPAAYAGSWSWQIGPFDIYCGRFAVNPSNLSLPVLDSETILLQEERDMIKEED